MIAVALVPLAVLLCSCSSNSMSQMPASLGGLPAGTPERPATPPAYPSIFDAPPPRDDTVMTNTQQRQTQDDLLAARDQAKRFGAPAARNAQ